MSIATSDHRLSRTEFDSLYRELTQEWASHQALKASNAPLSQLAASNARLFKIRMAMGSWHRQPLR